MDLLLRDSWAVRAIAGPVPSVVGGGRTFPAAVPGCIHLDLLRAGVIADPYLDENERDVQWIGRTDWRYETVFNWDSAEGGEVDLVALGLDTVAVVELNGVTVARTANMHRSYRFPVAGLLRAGSNDLAITFTSALVAAEAASEALGPRPLEYPHPFNALRKMACNFGWDWGPDLVTAGIWRPIFLQSWRTARIAAVRPLVTVDGATGILSAHVDVQRSSAADAPLTIGLDVAGQHLQTTLPAGVTSVVVEVAVPKVELWWPHGFGGQPLYPVTITLSDPEGERLDDWRGIVGFRTVTLTTTPDAQGTPFTLLVNGMPVFARGVNWIPDDAFPSRIGRERYAERLRQARDANVNLIRVWGGGIYESEDFYGLCDELGLLVWQDFLFACAAYAEEEPLCCEVIAEAREAITRLSPHPSLALWNGGNENIWGHQDWGWKEQLDGRTWGWGYYTDVLPALLAELDPTRPYSPGSPYSITAELHPNDPAHGTVHIWDVWNERDYTAYRAYSPRFVSEFGFQGPPTWATLTRAIHDDRLTAESPGMLWHQKAQDGNAKLARGLHGHLPEPESFDDWHWATSLNQARAIAYGIEHFRSLNPTCMGTVLWQFNDCWRPVTSWAAVDGDGRRKPLWFALRHAYRDRLLTVQPRDGGLALIAVNDSGAGWTDTVQLTRRTFDGSVLAASTVPLDVPPRGVTAIRLPAQVTQTRDSSTELLLARGFTAQAWWNFVEDLDAALPAPQLATELKQVEGGYQLSVTAHTLVRDLAVLADRVAPDAVVDDMLVTMLPGETVNFVITTAATLHLEQLRDPLVLRSANQLVAAPTTVALP